MHAYQLFDEMVLRGHMGFMELFKALFAESFSPIGAQLLYENLKTLAEARANVATPLLQPGGVISLAITSARAAKQIYDTMMAAIGT